MKKRSVISTKSARRLGEGLERLAAAKSPLKRLESKPRLSRAVRTEKSGQYSLRAKERRFWEAIVAAENLAASQLTTEGIYTADELFLLHKARNLLKES